MAAKKTSKTEEYKISGDDLMEKLKKIVKEGNVRKIVVRNKKGTVIAEFPLTVGVVGAVIAPPLAAIGAIVALVSECSISVIKENQPKA